ncbi:hypothetical protein [Streptomyces sp. NPDC050535]|uniref:hypothetical protein n=1 Tax=Streptomyces sp. NPDC050535 TaxID=3365626 RepID=UPI0037B901AC
MATWTLLGPAHPALIGFVMVAGLIYMLRMRKEIRLPNHSAVTVGWLLGFLGLSLAPWALAPSFTDDPSRGGLFVTWCMGFSAGLALGAVGGVLWTRAALRSRLPGRGQR